MGSRFRKNLMLAGAAAVVVLTVAIIVLFSQANRIIKNRLELVLGENFAVASLSLSWNRVEVNEPRFMKDGRVAAQARRIVFTPDILSLLRQDISVSSVVLEEPSLALEIDKGGHWVVPVAIGKKPGDPSDSKRGPVSFGRIEITDGTLVFRDHRRPEPNRIELRKIHLSLDRVSVPLGDQPSAFTFRMELAGNLVSGSANGSGTLHLKTLSLNGKFGGQDLVLLEGGTAGPVSRVQKMSFTAASEGMAAKPLILSDLVLVKPYLRLQSDRAGKVVPPLKAKKEEQEGASAPVEVKNLKIEGGELLYLDGKIAQPPHPVRFTDIDLAADQLCFPADDRITAFSLSARLPGNQGTGGVTATGTTALKALDTSAKVALRNLDITAFKPYLLKEGDVDVSRGFFDLDMDLGIKKRMLHAPSHSVLRELEFVEGRGRRDQFLGVPRHLVVNALKTRDNRIEIDFVVEGSLDNPKFSLRESMATRLTVALAKTLGLSVFETGGQVIIQSGRLMKGAGDVMKQIFK